MQLKSYLVTTGEQAAVSGGKGWLKEAVEKRLRVWALSSLLRVLGTRSTPLKHQKKHERQQTCSIDLLVLGRCSAAVVSAYPSWGFIFVLVI